MTALDFPDSPTPGQLFTAPGGIIWEFEDPLWVLKSSGSGTAGGVIFGDPANPPAGMAVGQQLYGPGGPTTVYSSWLFRPSGNLVAGQVKPYPTTFAEWVNIQFAPVGPGALPSFDALRDMARPGDIITFRLVSNPAEYMSARVLYMGGGRAFGFTSPSQRGTFVWIDPATITGTIAAWWAAIDTPVTVEVSPNPDLSAMWLMTETGLVRTQDLEPVPLEIPTMIVSSSGGVSFAHTSSTSAGNIVPWTYTLGYQSSDPDVFQAVDETRLRILQPGRYRFTFDAAYELATPGTGGTPDPGPTPQRNGYLTASIWRFPSSEATIGANQTVVLNKQIPWGMYRGVMGGVVSGYTEILEPHDIIVRVSENGGWPVTDTWRLLPSQLRIERLAFDQ